MTVALVREEGAVSSPVFDAIRALLDGEKIAYRHVHHEPTFTSEESAKARGEEVRVGGKALVVKVGEDFRLLVLSAAKTADWGAIKRQILHLETRIDDLRKVAQRD